MKKRIISIWALICLAFFACKAPQISRNNGAYIRIDSVEESASIQDAIKPYRGDLMDKMEEVIGYAPKVLDKGKPNAPLGNYLSDLLVDYLRKKMGNSSCDFALFNNGGFRIPLPGDSIRVGTIFELMPFENELVLVSLPADSMFSVAKYMKIKGGEAFSKDLQIHLQGSNIRTLLIEGKEIEKEKTYQVLTSDYLSTGGDNMSFFKGMKVERTNIKLRDAIIEAMKVQFEKGINVEAEKDARIIIE